MICVHTYITLRCEFCGVVFGDEYEYADTATDQVRIVMDARRDGWQRSPLKAFDMCPECIAARKTRTET